MLKTFPQGYGEGGALTTPLRKNSKAVVLLDEIEKAHPDVLSTFLQVFDDGRVTDSQVSSLLVLTFPIDSSNNYIREERNDCMQGRHLHHDVKHRG